MHITTIAGIFITVASVSAWSTYRDGYTDLLTRDYDLLVDNEFVTLSRRLKPKLSIPKNVRGSTIKPNEEEHVRELGEKAMIDKGVKKATLTAGWHDGESTSSRDKNKHFDITPDANEANQGVIHVYPNGMSTQGKERLSVEQQSELDKFMAANPDEGQSGGKKKGKKGKRAVDLIEDLLYRRELEDVDFDYLGFLQARQLYHEALGNSFEIDY